MLQKFTLVSAALALALAQNVVASGMDKIRVNGFVNTVGSVSDSSTQYLDTIDSDGSWSTSNFGLTVNAKIDQKLSVAAQLHGRASSNNVSIFDWAYGRYQVNNNLIAKAGRMKYSGNLVSEYLDVGYAYPWVRPPEVVYSEEADLFFESYNGVATVFSRGDDIEYSAELYGGADTEEVESHDKLIGLTLRAVNDYGELKLAYNRSDLVTSDIRNGKEKTYFSLGGKVDWNQWLVLAEYVRSEVENVSAYDSYGAFATVGYRINRTMPHLTYQKFDKNGGANQSGWTLGVRHNVGPATALKLEVQRVKPKGGGLFVSQPTDSSIDIINAAVNFVF